ncbi:MAG TPA: acetate--CoA ligase family protein [Steroidobacteraceae bacterium]|nr:acetate--CoA ligase family protein [Steroidobacteraceae bacterium]
MTSPQAARGPKAVARFLRPRSVAIVGISSRPGSAGQVVLQSLKLNHFKGDIHLIGRSNEPIDGRLVLKSPDQLPEGVDLAVFTLPAAGVRDAIEACARRKVGSAMIFAAGFAEVGDHATQEAVTNIARAAGLAVVGPNCLGVLNNVDGMMLNMLYAREARRGVKGGVSFVGQSGGLIGHFQRAADGRGLPLAYAISSGNEGGLENTDYLEFLADDPATRVIAIYCEQIRRPAEFLAACRRARAAGKPVVLMFPGRGAKSRKAALSHTGALVGDYAAMRTQVENAGAVVLATMDEVMDLVEILVRYPVPPTKGPGILTASGAYVALTNDFAEELGLAIPELASETIARLKEVLPAYGNYGNPLDTTAGFSQEMLPIAVKSLLDDPNVGMLFISFPINAAVTVRNFNKGMQGSPKPKVMVALGDTWTLVPEILEAAKESPAVFSRSSDRMLRAIAHYTRYGRLLARSRAGSKREPFERLPKLGRGPQPEWLGKKVFAAAGIRVPDGKLAHTADEAVAAASRIGYPVALKAQAAALTHKTEVGGVMLNLIDSMALRAAWAMMLENMKCAAPHVALDGILVEKMSPKGVELMIGAKRDQAWGTVLLVGLGGIWVEALGDVELLPVDAEKEQIMEALNKLRASKLLTGFRGAPPADVDAVAQAVLALGRLMQTTPDIVGIDVNPLMVHAKGEGATALDALIVAE